jgi:hypothetical protein
LGLTKTAIGGGILSFQITQNAGYVLDIQENTSGYKVIFNKQSFI